MLECYDGYLESKEKIRKIEWEIEENTKKLDSLKVRKEGLIQLNERMRIKLKEELKEIMA